MDSGPRISFWQRNICLAPPFASHAPCEAGIPIFDFPIRLFTPLHQCNGNSTIVQSRQQLGSLYQPHHYIFLSTKWHVYLHEIIFIFHKNRLEFSNQTFRPVRNVLHVTTEMAEERRVFYWPDSINVYFLSCRNDAGGHTFSPCRHFPKLNVTKSV